MQQKGTLISDQKHKICHFCNWLYSRLLDAICAGPIFQQPVSVFQNRVSQSYPQIRRSDTGTPKAPASKAPAPGTVHMIILVCSCVVFMMQIYN